MKLRRSASRGSELLTAKRRTEGLAIVEQGMEEGCERENCLRALKRVKSNKGNAGMDGMTVEELPGLSGDSTGQPCGNNC